MPTDKASYKAQNTGDTTLFKDSPPSLPDKSEQALPFEQIAPDHLPVEKGSDTYVGIPGDGIVPG